MWTCVNPIAKSIHSKVFSGESGRIPKTQATKRDRVNTTQKRTAGPRCGPLAQRIHREVGILMWDRMLATSSGISMAGKAMKLAMGLSSVHSIRTSWGPGWRLNKTCSPCLRIGTLRCPTSISVTVAPAGNAMACSPPRLDSIWKDRSDFRCRFPTST